MAGNKSAGIIAVIVMIGLLLYFNQGETPIFSATPATIDFAGFNWDVVQNDGSITKEKDFLIMQVSGSGDANFAPARRVKLQTDVSKIDEILVIADSSISVSSSLYANGAGIVNFGIEGSEGGSIGTGFSLSIGSHESRSESTYFEPQLMKLRNNFDGTWSSLQSIGVGDIFIVKDTKEIKGDALLTLESSCLFSIAEGSASVSITSKAYNVVVKEFGFAVCKADEFWQDKNQDGTPTADECFDLATIVLNSEEAIKESFEAKLARIELELLKKNEGLTEEIERLKQLQNTTAQQQKLLEIEEELAGTQLLLKELQDRNKELLDLIQKNEQITVVNQTIVVVQPTITTINETKVIIKEPVIVKEGIPTSLKVIGGAILAFLLFRVI